MPESTQESSPPRTAVVSGGSSGIGRAIVEAFLAKGWKVAFGARREERVNETARSLGGASPKLFGGRLDVTDAASIDGFYDAARAALGPIDTVVNCAAHARPGAFYELSADEIRSEIDTGLIGALLFSRRGVIDMLERKARGHVIFISSTTAGVPWPFHSPYAASKAGLEQAARSISLELEGTGIRSTIVRVGNTVGTGWAGDWDAESMMIGARWQQLGLIRHDGFMQPENVAHAVVAAVSTPPGFQLDHVSVHPEAPKTNDG
ncbi:MAG: SDR family NAD(P)-dependent oxidoreductase [Candidatus Binatia bacterium]|nr:SDR family NAD(P)-dependent oxidoreductase [Candidatus Binatia bacterium]